MILVLYVLNKVDERTVIDQEVYQFFLSRVSGLLLGTMVSRVYVLKSNEYRIFAVYEEILSQSQVDFFV